ncbi:hypothetical protein WJX84_006631 [Apatococcus fuscideae]|uniref:DNA-directed RNA polymerases I and III subunit RPAC1 n=1 Tax=Apatococcus fuscideae TaxID=2026836 RepID=A0AAW1TGT0_9CHLO
MTDESAGKRRKKQDGKATAQPAREEPSLPPHLELQRTHVVAGADINANTMSADAANMFMALGIDNSWSYEKFLKGFQLRINKMDKENATLEFDIIGIDASIANALRRILISEVPTMAIEHVFFVNNTSIIADEMLAHRLGLVPLQVDPNLFEWKQGEDVASERNTIVMGLNIACRREGTKMINTDVLSSELKWLPEGSELPDETLCRFVSSQAEILPNGMAPTVDNILLARLRPGQCIHLEAHCIKGQGREHAKWSPVATAWYRLNPEVVLLQEVGGDAAEDLAAELPGLIVVQDGKACVTDPRAHDILLEKVRRLSSEERWAPYIQLRKRKDHFIFTVESTGILPPEVLLQRALDIMIHKCQELLKDV